MYVLPTHAEKGVCSTRVIKALQPNAAGGGHVNCDGDGEHLSHLGTAWAHLDHKVMRSRAPTAQGEGEESKSGVLHGNAPVKECCVPTGDQAFAALKEEPRTEGPPHLHMISVR
jgi:hypothetical protein